MRGWQLRLRFCFLREYFSLLFSSFGVFFSVFLLLTLLCFILDMEARCQTRIRITAAIKRATAKMIRWHGCSMECENVMRCDVDRNDPHIFILNCFYLRLLEQQL